MKKRLRQDIKKRLYAMEPQEIASRSCAACTALIALDEFKAARAVMLYMPIAHEVDCLSAAMVAWQQDKTVLVPKVDRQRGRMTAVTCRGMDDDMVSGSYGIREPANGELWLVEEIDFIVVPALAYDRSGNRLGRGAGFYDRFLSQKGLGAVTCGLAFDEQGVDAVPVHDHDWPVAILVTDKEVLRFNNPPKT